MYRRQHVRQHVLSPVLGLASEDVNLCLAPLALGNVSGDFRCTDDFAASILDGGEPSGKYQSGFCPCADERFHSGLHVRHPGRG